MATKSVLSNVDLIRRFVFENQPVTVDEITAETMAQMASVKDPDKARDRYVLPVLKANVYYREVNGKWEVVQDEMPEYKVLRGVFTEELRLLYDREVRSKIAKKLGVKVHTVVLDLERAPGLRRDGAHWGLEEWVIVNDQAAEVLEQHQNGLTEKDLVKAICDRFGLKPDIAILHLKSDKAKRFIQDRKNWYLKKVWDAKVEQQKEPTEQKLALPDLRTGEIDLSLEGSFLDAQSYKLEFATDSDGQRKGKLKKLLKKQAQEMLEQREKTTQPEDLAAKLSQELSTEEFGGFGASYQRVEPATKEKGLSNRERDDIQEFLDELLKQETVGVGAPLPSVVNSPLSARKVQDVLRLKYINYTRDRAVLPNEYYRCLVEILMPTVNDAVIHPSCFDGCLTVELLNFLFDRLKGAAWTLTDEGSGIQVVQADGARYQLGTKDSVLTENARDRFIVTQVDLLNHFLNYKYTGVEADKILSHSARIITRLTGYDNTYIVNRDYLSELPEVFNYSPNDSNSIPDRFDLCVGNFTFTQDANLAANYLDQSLSLLAEGGRLGIFVLSELMRLLRDHGLLSEFLQEMAVTHYINLPVIEGRHDAVILVIRSLESGEEAPKIINAQVSDFKSANNLSNALQKGEGAGDLYQLVDQKMLTSIIR